MAKSTSRASLEQPRSKSRLQILVFAGIAAVFLAEALWLVLIVTRWFPYSKYFERDPAYIAAAHKAESARTARKERKKKAKVQPAGQGADTPAPRVAKPAVAKPRPAASTAVAPTVEKPEPVPAPRPRQEEPAAAPAAVVEAPVPGVKQVEKETPAPGPVPGLPADLVAQPAPVPEPIDEAVFADEDDAIAAAVAAAVAEFPLKEDVGDDDLPPALAPDLVMERAAEMMELATRYAKEGKLEEADRELERIQTMAPEYVEVYVTRARLYERRDLLNEAKAQWQQVVMWAKDPLLREEAEQAQRRLADESIQRTRAEIRIHEERAEATAARRLSVGDVRQEHLLQSADYDEMRLLRIELQRAPGARPIDVRKVEVVVVFFDRGKTSGTLIRTRAVVPDEPLTLNGVWRNNEKRNVTAAYIVPRDFRRGETRDYGEEFTYYGYVVEVRYEDVVQDRSTNRERLLRSL